MCYTKQRICEESASYAVLATLIVLFNPISIALSQSRLPYDPYVAASVEDASLNALAVNTPDQVWSVGDRGAIWATLDGGRNWTRQESGTTANLHAVAFRDAMNGWAVGGLPGVQSRVSRGVVLRTTNGGKTWDSLATAALPRFTGLRIVGGKLIAWGDFSVQHRSAILYSLDEGKSWSPMPSSIVHVGALGADPSGAVFAVDRIGNAFNSQLGATNSFYATSPSQPLAFIEHLGNSWLAGGSGGQLMRTVDGQSWSRVTLPLSPNAQRACSWRTAAVINDHLWVAGSPGSIVMHSPNRGMTWETLTTDQTLPLRAIAFADQQRGWAVGPLGLILATRDGGRTWYIQHKTALKLGLLAVTARATQTPWGALVATSWDDSIAAGALTIFENDPAQSADFRVENWVSLESLAPQLGLVKHESWQVSEPPGKPSSLAAESPQHLTERLLVELCCWRPDVVLTDETGDGKLSELNHAIIFALAAATESAAKTTPPAICAELDLPSWRVSKLAAVTNSRSGQYTEQISRLLREPGLSIWDILQPLGMSPQSGSQKIAMRTLQFGQAGAATTASLMGGIAPSPTSRVSAKRGLGNYQLIMGRVHRTTSLEGIANLPLEMPLGDWQSQLDFVLQTLPSREIASMLMRVADLCSTPQQWVRRQVVLERLAQLQPDTDAATFARMQMLQLQCSDELSAWALLQSSGDLQLVNTLRDSSRLLISANGPPRSPFDAQVVTASATVVTTDPSVVARVNDVEGDFSSTQSFDNNVVSAVYTDNTRQSPEVTSVSATDNNYQANSQLGKNAQRNTHFFAAMDACTKADPYLMDSPALLMMYQSVNRANAELQPGIAPSPTALEQVKSLQALAGWPQIARQELVLAAGRAEQLRWIALAMATEAPPRLDGVLNEPMWNVCSPMQLTAIDSVADEDQSQASTKIRWAYDNQYLYLAIDSPRTLAVASNRSQRTRHYDSDLHLTDHVQILLDTDRDYASAVELGISAQGETYDSVCGFTEYNPKWFVAVPEAGELGRWTAEIAIRLADLTTRTDLAGRAWAVSAYRRNPSDRDQSWSLLKTNEPCLQAAGLLLFVPPMPIK